MNLKTLLIAGCACAIATSAFAQGMGGRNLDANGDGKIDKAEYAGSAKTMFERFDADKDGKITSAETSGAGGGGQGGGFLARMLGEADGNKDGAITLAELTASREAAFDRLDTNKDGALSQDEMAAGRPARPGQ
jgi:Ca2+-binding EF-hand superfamily protein